MGKCECRGSRAVLPGASLFASKLARKLLLCFLGATPPHKFTKKRLNFEFILFESLPNLFFVSRKELREGIAATCFKRHDVALLCLFKFGQGKQSLRHCALSMLRFYKSNYRVTRSIKSIPISQKRDVTNSRPRSSSNLSPRSPSPNSSPSNTISTFYLVSRVSSLHSTSCATFDRRATRILSSERSTRTFCYCLGAFSNSKERRTSSVQRATIQFECGAPLRVGESPFLPSRDSTN